MGSIRYTIDTKEVTHETIDGEVVAICLRSGYYYSMSGSAGKVWELLDLGLSVEQIAEHLWTLYDVDAQTVLRDVGSFLADLETEGLLLKGEFSAEPCNVFPEDGERLPYSPPSFERFDDMKEMLILDPIHDVSDAGWPFRKAICSFARSSFISPKSDLEKGTLCPPCHYEHLKGNERLKGAWQSHRKRRDCFVSLATTTPKSGFGYQQELDNLSLSLLKCYSQSANDKWRDL